jgi:hypothetical protein
MSEKRKFLIRELVSIRTPEFKLILNRTSGGKELFYLRNDIKEQLNVGDGYPEIVEMLEREVLSLRN